MDAMIIIIFVFMFLFMLIAGAGIILYVWIKPFIPYLKAKLEKKDVLLIIGKDNKIRLIPAKYSAGVYTTVSPPYSFLHKIQRAYRLGDLQCVIAHDGWGVTMDPDWAEVIEELKSKGVMDYEELDRRINSKDVPEEYKDHPEDWRLHHSDIIRIHAWKDIDFGNVLNYVADMTPTEIRAHIDEYIAKFTEEQRQLIPKSDRGNMTTFIVIILVAIIGIAGLKMMGIF
jgi:hypothetical protein